MSTRLDDPGVGLRDNGRRVLTYADLRSMVEPADNTPPTREIELHLTGNMERYMWSINGVKFSDAKPIMLKHGERVRFVLVNDTMMTTPSTCTGSGAIWNRPTAPSKCASTRFRSTPRSA